MSTPFTEAEDPVGGAISEISSAISALNMEPSPIKKTLEEWEESSRSLAETDEWAAHAVEHMRAAIQYMQQVQIKIDSIRHFAVAGLERRRPPSEILEKLFEVIST